MWRTLLAYFYAALLALSLRPLGSYDDSRSPLFWQVILARIPPGTLPPGILCDLRDRAQLPRDEQTCGGAEPPGAPAPPADQPAP